MYIIVRDIKSEQNAQIPNFGSAYGLTRLLPMFTLQFQYPNNNPDPDLLKSESSTYDLLIDMFVRVWWKSIEYRYIGMYFAKKSGGPKVLFLVKL